MTKSEYPKVQSKVGYHPSEQEGQVALNRSHELYLLKAGHVPGDTWGRATFGPRGII